MKNLVGVWILTLGLVTSLSGQETEPELKKLSAAKGELFSVVQVGNEVKIIKKSELSDLKKDIETRYKTSLKEHAKAKADARTAKQEFTTPAPVKERLTVLSASVKTQEAAEKIREKALNDYVVVKVQDGSLKVLRKIEFASFQAKLDADYRVALVKYNDAKKSAKKGKQSFNEPAPAKPKIRVLASRLPSEEAANEKMKALQGKEREPKTRTKSKTKTREVKKRGEKENDEAEETGESEELNEDDPQGERSPDVRR